MKHPLVVTVILNTNRREDTLACLDSLAVSSYPNHRIIVLDNASSDGSVEAIGAAYPQVQLIELSENLGYAGNNNVGIKAALELGARWVWVLNEDTIVAPECIGELVAAAEADSRIGIVGPLVYHHNEPDIIQSAGGRLGGSWEAVHLMQNQPDSGRPGVPSEVDWISGCAILVRREVIEQAGMLDERFFYYWEEVEWCLRARRDGWRIVHVPAARLWHKGVQRDYRPKPSVAYYNTRNRLLMLEKHRAPTRVWVGTLGQTMRTLLSYSVRPKWRHKRDHRDAIARGMLDFVHRRWGRGTI